MIKFEITSGTAGPLGVTVTRTFKLGIFQLNLTTFTV